MRTQSVFKRTVARAGMAVAAAVTAIVAVFVVQASAASASTSWSKVPGDDVKAWGTTNSDCVITWNVKDTARDGHGVGVRFLVNDGSERTIDHFNFAGYGKTASGAHDFRNDASVAVKTFLTEGGKVWWLDVNWKQLC